MTHGPKAYPCHYSTTGLAFEHKDGNACSCKPLRLTKPQKGLLESAVYWTDEGETVGVIVKGAGRRTAEKLSELGLVEYLTHGVDVNAEGDDHRKEWPVYRVTDLGRAVHARVSPQATAIGHDAPVADRTADRAKENDE